MLKKLLTLMQSKRDRAALRQEAVDAAMRDYADAIGDAEAHRCMADYYTARADAIKPDKDWHGYAAMKDLEKFHRDNYSKYGREATDANARYDAALRAIEAVK